VPDECRTSHEGSGSGPAPRVNLIAGFFEFAEKYPALMKNGKPRSWAHYCYGMAELTKRTAQEKLRTVECLSIMNAKPEQYAEWRNHHHRIAGY